MSPVSVGTSRSMYLESGKAKLWVLLVGINKYSDSGIPTLRYSAVDCQGLTEALADATQKFPDKEVIVHHDFATLTPELFAAQNSLKYIISAARPQDTVLFYFSGHGFLEPKTQQAVLCLADTRKDDLLNTGWGMSELLGMLGECAATQQLVWLDACHSGGMTLIGARGENANPLQNPTSQLVELLRQRATQSKGFYALLSCDQGQQSWEFPELGHGVFTYFLIRGLRGEAADAQGVIEVDGLYKYVYHRTLQHVDKTNQQLRLINQQKRSRGETNLHSEYPIQTPKRIVEGIGELILGLSSASIGTAHPRQALVINGLASYQATVELSKVLRQAGKFELEYLPRPGKEWSQVRDVIQGYLRSPNLLQSSSPNITTAFLYLRGRIEETTEGDSWLVLGDGVRLSRSWLRQELRRSHIAQQIIVLDCPGATLLADWVEDLQLGPQHGQCLIAAASPLDAPEQFTQALLQTLTTADPQTGLPVAAWIAQLQVELAGTNIPLHVWLSGVQGVIEVLPNRVIVSRGGDSEDFDLGLCPYMGLKAFGEADAPYFYGREALTQKLINELSQRAFLAVVGASGSGKSSVVQAGLMAQLRQGKQFPGSESWWLGSIRPGTKPMLSLVQRLVDAGTEKEKAYQALQLEGLLHLGVEGFVRWLRTRPEPMVVLVVDQFEELFTLSASSDRQQFLDILLGAVNYAADRFKLVITLRADFINSCLETPSLAPVLQQASVLVPPCLTCDDYRQVIVQPAQQVGLHVEPELVEVLLQDLPHSAGDLPLLEFVLEQLWLHRQSGVLTLQSYQQQIGGLKGVLEKKAQAVYDSLEPEAQACAQWIFLTLTQLGDGTEDTRRRVNKSEMTVAKYPAPLVEKTLQALTAAKLIVVNCDEHSIGQSRGASSPEVSLATLKQEVTIEIAHEVLIRHWSTLRWWLEENRTRLQVQRQIEQAASLWKQNQQHSDFLLHGVRLAEAEEIYVKCADELSPETQQFIAACLEARQQQHLQTKRRLKRAQLTAGVMSVLGFTACGLAGIAYLQRQNIQIESLNSLSTALLSTNQQLEALSVSIKAAQQVQQTLAVPYELQIKTASTLQQVLSAMQERNRFTGHAYSVNAIAISPDGQIIASASDDSTIKLWHQNGKLVRSLLAHTSPINSISFSADGQTLASASDDGVKLWNVNGTLIKTLSGQGAKVTSFSPDGKIIAASDDSTIKLWHQDGTLVRSLLAHTSPINSISFSADGQTLASASDDGVKLWNVNGTFIKTLQGHNGGVTSVSFSPAGMLATASRDNTIALWSREGNLLKTLKGHSAPVNSVSFSPNGMLLASASDDFTVKLWNHERELETFKGHTAPINSVSFSANGMLVSAGVDNTLRLWSIEQKPIVAQECPQTISVSFSANLQDIALVCRDNTVTLWNRNANAAKTLKEDNDIFHQVSFSPDGSIAAAENTVELQAKSIDAQHIIKLWSRDGVVLKSFTGHNNWLNSVSFSPDGNLLASASDDKTVKLWTRDGREVRSLQGHQDAVNNVAFSPNSQIVASASKDATVKLWSVNGKLLNTLQGHNDAVSDVSFSADGQLLASASVDNTVKLWRLDGKLITTLQGHSGWINDVSFSPDGKLVASASDDSTIKLWNIHGQLLGSFSVKAQSLGVKFTTDSKNLVAVGSDNAVRQWTLDLNQLVAQGCNWLSDYLTTNSHVNASDRHLCKTIN
ncbi:WD-40 repeat-containing protein [Gloeocapsa sp. PCC 7428]|uniref:nSTAND1 domain-containing NTPase n=1 Tax=Gloeocapsa sp. PCC 7428 TaxID=1173026 RepID=UPI0002A5E0DC|nr:caspase family protein [Gloeocapsa sp. PCC 7428]AFZ32636.1 WD-40 repeat-containing protein [Gloeocapsa sp. PCC 7428]